MYKTAVKHKINKKEVVERLKQKILSSSAIIIANYQGLNVAQITEFRRELAKHNAKFEVVRQKLFEIALRNTKCEEIKTFISNAIGIITCSDEEKVLDVTKYLIEYAKQNNKFKILGGYLYERICDPAKINEIAKLPSKIELIAVDTIAKFSNKQIVFNIKVTINFVNKHFIYKIFKGRIKYERKIS